MTRADFDAETHGLGIYDDCPVCGYSWPGCCGRCIKHEPVKGIMGPFHSDYNDDCELCEAQP